MISRRAKLFQISKSFWPQVVNEKKRLGKRGDKYRDEVRSYGKPENSLYLSPIRQVGEHGYAPWLVENYHA